MENIIEAFFCGNMREKWLIICSNNPKKALIAKQMAVLSKNSDIFATKYDNLLFWGNFNAELEDTSIKNFCVVYSLTGMINEPSCYKNPEKPSCIDLILTKSAFFPKFLCYRDRLIRFS